MIKTSGLGYMTSQYDNTMQKKTSSSVKKNENVSKEVVKSSEDKLSSTAKDYLDKLRKEYGDYDFIIADAGDDKRALLDNSNKEYSIMLSTSELEKMAKDENYASEKMRQVQTIVDMTDRICEQFGMERNWGKDSAADSIISKMAVSINDDGSMTLFAELEKMSEKQKEHIENIKEKNMDKKKEIADKKETEKLEEKKINSYKKDETGVKKVLLEASSEEELIEKINNVDWNMVTAVKTGAKLDLTV